MNALPPEQRIFRDKISGKMAFPLGYELLERTFGDLPPWPRCEFWFKARPTYWASDFARELAASERYPIACLRHRNTTPGFTFYIYPVARELKSVARDRFLASAVEEFREFLAADPPSPNFRDIRQAVFDPISHVCTVER